MADMLAKRSRSDSEIVTLKNGKKIEYHPSFRFPYEILKEFPAGLYDRMTSERQAYKKRRNGGSSVQETQTQAQAIASAIISEMSRNGNDGRSNATPPPNQVTTDNQSAISQVTTGQQGSTMFGGRNSRTTRGDGR